MKHFLVLLVTSLWLTSLLAQQPQDIPESEDEPVEFLESITVTGTKSLSSMRFEIQRAEDNLYSMFNELNRSNDMDIVCRIVQKANSQLRQRVCEPVFFSKLRKENSQRAYSDIRMAFTDGGIDAGIDPVLLENGLDLLEPDWVLRELAEPDYQELNEEILRIALTNPDYLAALQQIAASKAYYELERQKRSADK